MRVDQLIRVNIKTSFNEQICIIVIDGKMICKLKFITSKNQLCMFKSNYVLSVSSETTFLGQFRFLLILVTANSETFEWF